jgi:hypothetical protein
LTADAQARATVDAAVAKVRDADKRHPKEAGLDLTEEQLERILRRHSPTTHPVESTVARSDAFASSPYRRTEPTWIEADGSAV